MPKFLVEEWGLETPEAVQLYNRIVVPLREEEGIVDAHTHLSVRQIVENEPFPDIFTAMVLDTDKRWPNKDHYIIQMLAGEGIPFADMYGDKLSNKEKWDKMAKVFPNTMGTQVHLWMQLELNKTLGIEGLLSEETADRIWNEAHEKLGTEEYKPQGLLKRANVRVLCTTDDPIDSLECHTKAAEEVDGIRILPTFRPDKAVNIFAPGWKKYVTELCEKYDKKPNFDGLLAALYSAHEHFQANGCRASDHGLVVPYGRDVLERDAKTAFELFYYGKPDKMTLPKNFSPTETFVSFMMDQLVRMNKEGGNITQIHFGALRNINSHVFKNCGPDSGGDASTSDINVVGNLSYLLDKHCNTGDPEKDAKIVLYCMDPSHYSDIARLTRVFPGVKAGSAWWFNDSIGGMTRQFENMNDEVPYSQFAGMVCDGRKLLSIEQRHDVYARVVCNVIGKQVENGLVPRDQAEMAVAALCYYNQAKLFGFGK
ncbi:MAG: glucuronate isomerase [Nanoarchaeota archaeon]|nr:glucuronate isomerase [Nanoarchaeota archaeon]